MTTTGHADAIYINGQVVTLDRQQPRANAVAIKDGKFLAAGAYDEVIQHQALRQLSSTYTTDKCCRVCMIVISI